MKKFSYSSKIKCLVDKEKDIYLAKASLENLGSFIPNKKEENLDVLPISFSAFVANRFNKNHDGIDGLTAKSTANLFINKPINIGHDRQKTCGVILSYNFASFPDEKPLNEEELNKLIENNEPFNIVLGGFVWKVVNEELTDLIQDSNDPSSENYLSLSASWEIGFSEYDLYAIEGNSRNLKDAKILEKNQDLEARLKQEGGSGKLGENTYIYRLATKDVLPLGIGITDSPAADVKGIATEKEEKVIEIEENNSHLIKSNVNIIESNHMKLKQVKKVSDLTDEIVKEASASEMTDFISTLVQDATKEIEIKSKEETKSKETALADEKVKNENLTKEINDFKNKNQELNKSLEEIKAKLKELEEKEAQRVQLEQFSARMTDLDKTFSLEKEEREVIASDIKDLDEKGFEKYKTKLNVLFKGKQSKASTNKEEKIEEILEQGKKEQSTIPNTSTTEKTIFDKASAAFAVENFEIQ